MKSICKQLNIAPCYFCSKLLNTLLTENLPFVNYNEYLYNDDVVMCEIDMIKSHFAIINSNNNLEKQIANEYLKNTQSNNMFFNSIYFEFYFTETIKHYFTEHLHIIDKIKLLK